MSKTVRILLIDRNGIFREGLRRILSGKRFSISGDANSFTEAVELMRSQESNIDLIIGDPGAEGSSADGADEHQAIATLRQEHRDLKIVVLTDRLTASAGDLALAGGISGLLSKDLPAQALKHSVELILVGGTMVPLAVIGAAPHAAAQAYGTPAEVPDGKAPVEAAAPVADATNDDPTDDADAADGLSGREYEILKCLAGGMSNKLIARQLDLAEATVKVHLRSLLRKLRAQNRTQAAIWAMKNARALTRRDRADVPRRNSAANAARFDAEHTAFM